MTVRFEGKVDSAALRRVRTAIATTPARIYPKLEGEFQRWGRDWKRAMEDRLASGTRGPNGIHSRTGNLSKSFSSHVTGGSIADLHLRCQSAGFNYARAQEYGAEITPKNAKHLTIPIVGNLKPSLDAKYPTVGSLINTFGRKRVFFLARAGKNTVVMLKDASLATTGKAGLQRRLNKNAKGSLTPMFVLVDKVTLPGPKTTGGKSRLGFFDEWAKLGQDRRRGLNRIGRELGRVGA